MIRIAINAVFLEPGRQGGVETYTHHLIEALQSLDAPEHFVIYTGTPSPLRVDHPRFTVIACKIDPRHRYRRILWEQIVLPRMLNKQHFDVVHFPYSSSPIAYRQPCVVSIHDTVRFQFPEMMPPVERMYRAAIERGLHRRQVKVIGISCADTFVLQDRLRLADDQIQVIPHGLDTRFLLESPPCGWNQRSDEVVWAGHPYPHKNLGTLLHAYRLLRDKGVALPVLRLIGCRDQSQIAMLKQQAGDLNELVSIEGPLSHDQMPQVYRSAKLLLFPSRYESFGMPVLEAMGCGTPAVIGDIPAMRELFSPIATLCSPDSPEQFAEAIERLLTDHVVWLEMAQRGVQHARKFSWETCARTTLGVYRSVANSHK